MRRALCSVALLGLLSLAAHASRVEIYDRATGEVLPVYEHDGRSYVAGEPRHEYEIRIHSTGPGRVLAVASVDGVNAITGETADTSQSGYVLDPYGFARIEGWRKSMSRTAAFYFTRLPDSYAARTGRPDNVGVIGVALFREKQHCCVVEQQAMREQIEPSAPADRAADGAARGTASAPTTAERADKRLGTGHGRSERSEARYTQFERAAEAPDETIVVYYDSRRNLVAQGIIPSHARYAERTPRPFPGGFAPDP